MTPQEELDSIRQQEKALAARRCEIYAASLKATEEDKICDDWSAEVLSRPSMPRLEYPVEITAIDFDDGETLRSSGKKWVSVRPCSDEHGGRTYLGVMLGDMALGLSCTRNRETGILHVMKSFHNPAMYVPDLHEVIYGCGSWWAEIESPEDLKRITDADIENVWYVRALRDLGGDSSDG